MTVDLQGVPLDIAAPIAVRVVEPVQVIFIPPASNPTLSFIRAGDIVPLTFRVTNILPPGTPVDGIMYTIDINGNTAPCENLFSFTSFGDGTFNGTLPNSGDQVDIICNYRPSTADHGQTKDLNFTMTHLVNGVTVPLSVSATPYMSALVEHVEMDMTLETTSGTSANVNDGDNLRFTWTLRNTGQTPLTNFAFSQNMLDSLDGNVVAGKTNLLTSGSPAHGLLEVFGINVALTSTCNDPLLPGDVCTAQATNPQTLFNSSDLTYAVLTSDPQQFLIRILGDARTNTGSNFTVMDTAEWRGTVQRPIVQLCGNGPSRASDSNGNIWEFNPACLTINPNPVVLGNEVTIQTTITNSGFQTLSNMTLTGNLGTPVAFDGGLSLTSGLNQAPATTVTFTLGATTLAPGASTTATATWTAEGVTPPTNVPFTSTFTANVPLPYAAYNVTSDATNINVIQDPTLPPGLDASLTEPIVTKTASAETAFPGEAVTWTITITNMSTAEMASVDMTDSVPGDLEIVSATTSSGASIVNGQLIDITTGALSPGEAVTVTINTNISPAAPVPGSITNIACGMREGGTEVCAEATVELGPGGILPDTGIGGGAAHIGGGSTLAQRLPFALAMAGVFFSMLFLSLNFSDRQRMGLAVLALLVVAVVISGVLLLAGGDGEEEAVVPVDGEPPPDASGVATATPVPSATPRPQSPTPPPTVAPDALATIASFPATATPYIAPTPAGPRRLDIPALGYAIPLPIVELPQINGEWDVTNLGHNIGWLDNTTWQDPLWGNTVLAGHVQLADTDPGPFNELHKLVPGDEIRIMEGDTITTYQVSEIFEVSPTDNSVTHPTDDPILTLITCTDWVDNRGVFANRLVVRALPVGTN